MLQEQPDGLNRPVGYWSRTLYDAEGKLSTTHKECLAIVWVVLLLRSYLDSSRFAIRTDHEANKWLLTTSNAFGKLARWPIRLSELEFDIAHRADIKHTAVDSLSRLPTNGADAEVLDNEFIDLTLRFGQFTNDKADKELIDDDAKDSGKPIVLFLQK